MNYDLVLHVDADDASAVAFAFGNMKNYLKWLPENSEARLVIVANGPAVKYFTCTKEHEALWNTGKELQAAGVSLRLCQNAINVFAVNPADLWEGCVIVPGGIPELVRLQSEGYAYIRP